MIFTGVGVVAALLMVIISIVVANNVFNKGCDVEAGCQSMLFITTTFLSSKRIETSLGFPVATERDLSDSIQTPFNDPASTAKDRNYRFGHFLECMYTSRMADKTCSPSLSFNDYAVCVQNNTLIPNGLDSCASFPSTGGYSHWPTVEEYIACVWNNPLLQNSESRRASQNVFRACVEQSLWPFFEVPQTIDSSIVFGSYNWGLFLVAGMIVLSSFVVYTSSPIETGYVEHGESSYFMRLGLVWSVTALVWNFVFFIIFVVASFRNSGEFQFNGGLPTTFSTSMVTILVTGAAVLYFLSVVIKPTARKFVAVRKHLKSDVATIELVPLDVSVNDSEHQRGSMSLRGNFPTVNPFPDKKESDPLLDDSEHHEKYELKQQDVAKYYTPPLLAIWSDSYLADFCFILGFAGATGQLSTDVAWHLFSLTFTYRVLNMIISRCISDAFTNNIKLSDAVNEYKNTIITRPNKLFEPSNTYGPRHKYRDVHINTKVIGLSTQLSAVFLYICIVYLVFNENNAFGDYTNFKIFFVLGFVVPEALRLLIHLGYQIGYDPDSMGNVPWLLYNSFYFVWLWDVVIRLVFVCIVLLDASGSPGTFDFLKTQTGLISRDYVKIMLV